MLLSSGHRGGEMPSDLDTVHNYYEHLVMEELRRQLPPADLKASYLADIACVALNHLPPRYIRHDVDMAFYLSPKERQEMDDKVSNAVRDAIVMVNQHGERS